MTSQTLRLVALLLATPVALCSCKGSAEAGTDPAAELRRLERVLLDTSDRTLHPVLNDVDLEPLRRLALRDQRVAAAREACVAQYEAFIRLQDANARCRELTDGIEAAVHESVIDDVALVARIAEAEKTCGMAETAIGQAERAKQECDEATGRLRRELGQTR